MTTVTYSSWHGAQRSLHVDADDPYKLVEETQLVLPDIFFERNKALAEDQEGKTMKLVARVPMTVYEQSLHEEWDDARWAQWLNDPDNRAFRVWPGRV